MPADRDKADASLPGDGVARRVTIRRSRPDRDGLFLFGRRYAGQDLILTDTDVRALERGRVIAVDIQGEYILYIDFIRTGSMPGEQRLPPASEIPGHETNHDPAG